MKPHANTDLRAVRHRSHTAGRVLLCLTLMIGLIAVAPESVRGQVAAQTVHVATQDPAASDTNPGTESEPLKTISRGAEIAQDNSAQGISTRVLIHPGTYREGITFIGPEQDLGASLTFEAVNRGTVIVKGSDVWTGWTRVEDGIYTREWPHDWGYAQIPSNWPKEFLDHKDGPLIQRREIVFVNGKLLRQVLRFEDLRARKKAFLVDEERNKVFIKVPSRLSPDTSTVEVALRQRLLWIRRHDRVTIDGLNFQHAASPLETAAVFITDAQGLTVQDSSFAWNNWDALSVREANNVTLTANVANRNGVEGMTGYKIQDLVADSNRTSYNNWRGWWAKFTVWTIGNKFFHLRNALFKDHTSIGNKGYGLWIDYNNKNVTIDGLVAKKNYGHGLVIDSTQGPTVVRNSRFCSNRHGIFGITSRDLTIEGNVFYNNKVAAIDPSGPSGTRYVTDIYTGETFEIVNEDWVIKRNLIVGKKAKQNLIGTYLDTKHWKRFKNTLTSRNNKFRHPRSRRVFQIARGYGDRYRWPELTFRGWKRHTGEDRNSTFRRTNLRPSCGR